MPRYRVDIEIQAGELTRRDRVTAYDDKHLERIRRNARQMGHASPGSTVIVTPTKISEMIENHDATKIQVKTWS